MLSRAKKSYRDINKSLIKKEIESDPYLLDGARIFRDRWNFCRLTDFEETKTGIKVRDISKEDFECILQEIKEEYIEKTI